MIKKQGPPAESPIEPEAAEPTIPPHWHYATSLMGGYSPGTDDTFPSITDVFDLAAELVDDLEDREERLLEILREAFETVPRGDDGPYLAENILPLLRPKEQP